MSIQHGLNQAGEEAYLSEGEIVSTNLRLRNQIRTVIINVSNYIMGAIIKNMISLNILI